MSDQNEKEMQEIILSIPGMFLISCKTVWRMKTDTCCWWIGRRWKIVQLVFVSLLVIRN